MGNSAYFHITVYILVHHLMVVIYLVTGDLDFTKVNSYYQPLT